MADDLGRDARIRNSATIGRNCDHLLQLINNHLDLAKIEAVGFRPGMHAEQLTYYVAPAHSA